MKIGDLKATIEVDDVLKDKIGAEIEKAKEGNQTVEEATGNINSAIADSIKTDLIRIE